MDFSLICRTCTKTYDNIDLNPIFLSEDTQVRCSNVFYSCTGVEAKLKDGLPQNMCVACMKQFNNILKFRKQCKEAETQLLKIKTELESENSSIVINEQHSIQITEEHPLIEKYLTTINESDVKNCSNITRIKSEYRSINIKNEPLETDTEEDRPLKYLIEKKLCSISLLKSNNDNELNTEDNSDTEYFNENESHFKTDNAEDFKCEIYLGRSQKNDDIIQNFSNTPETLSNSNVTEEKCTDIPYVVTETDAKKITRVVCKLCQKELSIRSIDSHMMRRHPGADERKVKCELCDKYVMRDKLNRHRVIMHGSIGVRCGYCKAEFKSKEVLVDHVTTCTAKNRKRKVNDSGRALAECDICKMTMQRASLNKHKAVKHSGLRPVCEHCGKSFGNKFRLNEHYRAKHDYEKFQCSYNCDFKSAGIMAMRNHERRHRGEKPFVCETCGAKFHAAYLLMQHKHSHKTEKLVKCDLCPAIFKANNNLHMHKLTCHSKSYYSCTLCARSYKCRYYAVKHVRLAHHVSDAPEVIKLMTQ